MLTRAARQITPEGPNERNEYHFRNLGETTFVCAYHWGAKGGLCGRTPLSEVKHVDELPRIHVSMGRLIPHAMTGEAEVLKYECKRGHMVREPYAYHFDVDGWMLEEWRPLQ